MNTAAVENAATRDAELFCTAFTFPDRARLQIEMIDTAALRADWLAFCLRPAKCAEGRLSIGVRHAKDFREGKRFSRCREKKML